jgi:protein-S-isoprenylcysteine O-methyltransferase Ste14
MQNQDSIVPLCLPAGFLKESVDDRDDEISRYTHSKSRSERYRITLSWFFGLAVFALSTTMRSHWHVASLMNGTLLLLGLSMAVVGCMGRVWCSLYIDGFKTSQLVSCGPYSICRNPLYFFSAIGAVGVAFGTATFLVPAIVVIGFAVYYPLIIRREQGRLLRLHGAEFTDYCSRVPVFFPRLHSVKVPETYVMYPRIVGRSLVEATWFVWFTMVFHLIHQLHQRTDLLPTLFGSF